MKIKKSGNKGLIKLIVLIIIGLAILKLVWDINISDVVDFFNKPQVKRIWEAFWNFLKMSWEFVTNLFTKN